MLLIDKFSILTYYTNSFEGYVKENNPTFNS